jgi:hypothetical protein
VPNEDSKLQVDDDWKAEAQREKERLEEQVGGGAEGPGQMPEASFSSLIEMLAMQALVSLGGAVGPGGERIPPNPPAAKHFVDMLQVLEDKTRNNRTEEEQKLLDSVLYEVRMNYVRAASGGTGPASPRA